MINTQGPEVPQPEDISRVTYEEKPGVNYRYSQSGDSQECHYISKHSPAMPKNITRELQITKTISPPQPRSVPVQNTPISCYSFSHL